MRKFTVLFTALMFSAVGCGIQEPDTVPSDDGSNGGQVDVDINVTIDDNTSDTPSDPVVDPTPDPAYVAGPFRSPGSCIWDFNSAYASDAICGEVRGELPNMTWSDGPALANPDGDGWMGMHYEVQDGTYTFSYLGFQNCGSSTPYEAWAQYGGEDQLSAMSPEDRAYISCNWWDATNQQKLNVSNPSCSLKVTVTNCDVQPAGNMSNFNL